MLRCHLPLSRLRQSFAAFFAVLRIDIMPVQPAVGAYHRPVLAGGPQPGAKYPRRLEGDEDDPGDYHGHGYQPAGRG